MGVIITSASQTGHEGGLQTIHESPRYEPSVRDVHQELPSAAVLEPALSVSSYGRCSHPLSHSPPPPFSAFGTLAFNHSGKTDAKSHSERSPGGGVGGGAPGEELFSIRLGWESSHLCNPQNHGLRSLELSDI